MHRWSGVHRWSAHSGVVVWPVRVQRVRYEMPMPVEIPHIQVSYVIKIVMIVVIYRIVVQNDIVFRRIHKVRISSSFNKPTERVVVKIRFVRKNKITCELAEGQSAKRHKSVILIAARRDDKIQVIICLNNRVSFRVPLVVCEDHMIRDVYIIHLCL